MEEPTGDVLRSDNLVPVARVAGESSLPSWLASPATYEPPRGRSGSGLRSNLLRLLALPSRIDCTSEQAFVDRLLSPVPALLRLVGLIVAVACISAARNMAFVWLVLAGVLLSLATRPTHQLRSIVPVATIAALVAGLLALPAALLGLAPASVCLRMAAKTLCTVALTLMLAAGVSWPRMASALTAAHLPATLVFVLDGTFRGITLLGRVAASLTEALALRDVGPGASHDASVGGVLGTTFLRAATLASSQAEAMACRGYDGHPTTAPEQSSPAACGLYLCAIAALVVCFFVLERALA